MRSRKRVSAGRPLSPVSGKFHVLSYVVLTCVLLSGLSLLGCTTDDHRNDPNELREKTAERTAELKSDAKSVAEGVRDGWNRDKGRVDLNTASRDQLVAAGFSREQSDRVIAHRPYATSRELVTKRVISDDEYQQIEPHIRAGEPSDR